MRKRSLSFLISFVLVFSFVFSAYAMTDVSGVLNSRAQTVQLLVKNVPNPICGSVGGEWCVFAVKKSGISVSDNFYSNYKNNLEKTLKEKKGILSERKYTEYSRVSIALSAIGENPLNFRGYNILSKVTDYDKTTLQGINGAVFALIALNSGNYGYNDIKEKYINFIVSRQNSDGSFSQGDKKDIDITAMSIYALSFYKERNDIKICINKSLNWLNNNKTLMTNSESVSQSIIAFTSVGLNAEDFGLVTKLMSFGDGKGGFKHLLNDKTYNLMSTEQALYALNKYIKII